MGRHLRAVIADAELLRARIAELDLDHAVVAELDLDHAVVAELRQDTGLVPATGALVEELTGRLPEYTLVEDACPEDR